MATGQRTESLEGNQDRPIYWPYCRVGIDDISQGCTAQKAALRADYEAHFTQTHNWPAKVVERGFFCDPFAAGGLNFTQRVAGLQLQCRLRAGDIVAITHQDRAFRSVGNWADTEERWRQMGVGLRLLDIGFDTSTEAGRAAMDGVARVAQWDREFIGMRTKEAVAVLRSEGTLLNGMAPMFFRFTRKGGRLHKLIPDDMEQMIGSLLAGLMRQGYHLCQVVDYCRAIGITWPRSPQDRINGEMVKKIVNGWRRIESTPNIPWGALSRDEQVARLAMIAEERQRLKRAPKRDRFERIADTLASQRQGPPPKSVAMAGQ